MDANKIAAQSLANDGRPGLPSTGTYVEIKEHNNQRIRNNQTIIINEPLSEMSISTGNKMC
jgi:hypothetical protein